MRKFLWLLVFSNSVAIYAQSAQETYRFSTDLLKQINAGTTAWKHQVGATELSFSSHFNHVLEIWDLNGVRKPKNVEQHRENFLTYKKLPAKDFIVEQSKKTSIVIINEAHHIPYHRTFTKSLLTDLYKNGYRYLGLEALFDADINERKFAITTSGYYTKEPEFGHLISEALKIGFTLFSYEATEGKNGSERENEQALNIKKFIENNPNGKVLIHCGYAHAFENEYQMWGKAMAGRLKEYTKMDPFTVDQTMFVEKHDPGNNHPFIELYQGNYPVVLVDQEGSVFNGENKSKQTDVVVIHPKTTYVNDRPSWLINDRVKYTVPNTKLNKQQPLLIIAYRNQEFSKDGIPADLVEHVDNYKTSELYLYSGKYTIVIKNEKYEIIDQYTIEI